MFVYCFPKVPVDNVVAGGVVRLLRKCMLSVNAVVAPSKCQHSVRNHGHNNDDFKENKHLIDTTRRCPTNA